jgi:hypothetical protein
MDHHALTRHAILMNHAGSSAIVRVCRLFGFGRCRSRCGSGIRLGSLIVLERLNLLFTLAGVNDTLTGPGVE